MHKFTDKELVPALVPGAIPVWNVSRWTKNRRVIKTPLRLMLVHSMQQLL